MAKGMVLVVANDGKGLYRLMHKGSILALDHRCDLKVMLVQPRTSPKEDAAWLEYAFRCAQYHEAELNVYCDEATRRAALEKLPIDRVHWAVAGGDFEFVRQIHRALPGVPIMSKHERSPKGEAALLAT